MHPDLAFALDLADLADAIAVERFQADDLVVETKPDLKPVTGPTRRWSRSCASGSARSVPATGVSRSSAPTKERPLDHRPDRRRKDTCAASSVGRLIALEREGRVEVKGWCRRRRCTGSGGRRGAKGVRQRPPHPRVQGGRAVRRRPELRQPPVVEQHGLGEQFLTLARASADQGFGDFWGHMLVAEARPT